MSILVDRSSKVICQGITGKAGAFHTQQCLEYGTAIVGGVTPGKGGTKSEHGLPVFDTCAEAVEATGADVSMIFVPAPFAADSAMEAAEAGIRLVVLITEGVPTLDMVRARTFLDEKGCQLIGPNCPGIITPGQCKIGIMPGYIHRAAGGGSRSVGVISRSGTLTYEAVWQCSVREIGQTTCVGIGGDPVKGLNFIELLDLFEADAETDAILIAHGKRYGLIEDTGSSFLLRWVYEWNEDTALFDLKFVDRDDLQKGIFIRGDANRDNKVDISDAVFILKYLFEADASLSREDSADANDNGAVNIADSIFILMYLFAGGDPPPPPGPHLAGPDPTGDGLAPCLLPADTGDDTLLLLR